MSDLYSATEILVVASEIVGEKGPIEIDSRIYSHNINMEESNKGNDLYILGENGNKVTFEEFIKLITKLNDLVDELVDETGRSYCFEGIEKVSGNNFIISWGS
tara:strand:- start:14035 stop:14343 length:309 start_codon:yes stop_codon:yes gene_type:complete